MKLRYMVMEILSNALQYIRLKKCRIQGYQNIHSSAILESQVTLDKVYPRGIHIGANTLIASRSIILTHEHVKRDSEDPRNPWVTNTYIGTNCFVGVGAVILPGVKIGNQVIVGAGTVVTKDVPSNSIVVGNPGRILGRKIQMSDRAILCG